MAQLGCKLSDALLLDTHYTRVHTGVQNDARVYGPWTRVSFWTPVLTGRGHG